MNDSHASTPTLKSESPPSPAVSVPVTSNLTSSKMTPAFAPRAIKKRTAPAKPSVTSLLSTTKPIESSTSSASSSTPLNRPTTSSTQSTLAPLEVQRLETILCTIESSFSDYGLSWFRSSGLLERLKSGNEWIHISQLLNLPPVRALTGTLADLQKAVKLRDSRILKVDESGYQVSRKSEEGLERFETLDPAEWDDLTIYLENVPFNASTGSIVPTDPTSFSLLTFLSSALDTPVQRLVLPPLFDPSQPLDLAAEEDDYDGGDGDLEGQTSQAEAFKASLAMKVTTEGGEVKRVARGLPKGGGPFKGFAFVVLRTKDEVERILKQWNQNPKVDLRDEEESEDEDVEMEETKVQLEKSTVKGKGKKKEPVSCEEKARNGGMKAISYARWLEFKKEYLAYRRTLERLLEAQASGALDRLRHPPQEKDQPPHLQHATGTSTQQRNKRASSPPHHDHRQDDSASSKRTKRASSPASTPLSRPNRKLRTPSPSQSNLDLASDAALSIQGAYPEGCVLWVRNIHEKSSKTSLKTLFGKLLDELQEGSGKGVEFVDYEKGLDTCYIRFSSAPLASLARTHLAVTQNFHLAPPTLSPAGDLSPAELAAAENDLRRPIAVELLSGEQERQYWANLPESTRKSARMGAAGKVALVKEPRRHEETGYGGNDSAGKRENGNDASGADGGNAEGSRKRKKPSRM